MKLINNKKGSAILWTVLLTVILTILLGSIMMAAYAYFNYTMYTVKRQQAYFTARSAINVLLEEFTSEEQIRTTTPQTTADGRVINFDGNYIVSGSVCKADGSVIHSSSNIDENGYLIADDSYGKKGQLVRRAASSSTGQYTTDGSSITVLPTKAGEEHAINVTDFGFDANMGTASAKIVRNEDNEVNINVTATYADQDYKMNATVVRQPVYFGGIAIKQLTLGGNLILGDNTDLYWNNTDLFDPSTPNGTYIKNSGNYRLKVQGNLVTKGNARIPAGTVVAGRKFTGTANFTNDGLHSKKIWSPTEYVISNKTLLVGDTNTDYATNMVNSLKNITATHTYYCNSTGATNAFGSGIKHNGDFYKLLEAIGLDKIVDDIADDRLALTNSESDALAIQYIDILSLSTTIANTLQDFKDNSKSFFVDVTLDFVLNLYNRFFENLSYDTLDVSYINFSSNDENNRSDEVVPLVYMFVRGGSYKGLTVRVRYGAETGSRTQLGQTIEQVQGNLSELLTKIFSIDNKPSYVITYLESGTQAKPATIHLGYDDDGGRTDTNPANLIFLYSIYGGENTRVVLHDGVTVVGEIFCDQLVVEGNARIIYSSTSGAQVAKQKIAEYWAVANYSD